MLDCLCDARLMFVVGVLVCFECSTCVALRFRPCRLDHGAMFGSRVGLPRERRPHDLCDFLLLFGLLNVRCGFPRSAVVPEAREDCSSRRGIASGVGVSLRLSAPAGSGRRDSAGPLRRYTSGAK